jgi:hypothetical protein
MNAARAIRHLEQAGFTHEQATSVIEIMQEEVLETLATREFVELACERVKDELRSEIRALRMELKSESRALAIDFRDRHTNLVKWIAGIAVMQTASIIFGTVGLLELLR